MRSILAGTAALALVLGLCTSPAFACWDGYAASYGRVTVMGGDMVWDAKKAELLARWLPRIDAIVPAGETLEVYFTEAALSGGRTVEFPAERYDVLFSRLAGAIGTSASDRRTAMNAAREAMTIQIAATRDRARADALVASLSDMDDEHAVQAHGFYEAGGFPAFNPAVHVITRREADGSEVHQVVVGAFVDRARAAEVRADLASRGFRAFIRPIDPE